MESKKPRFVDEWNLGFKAKSVVKRELRKWRDVFIERANGETGSVEKCDWKNDELFFFTDCHDLMGDNPESKAVEDEMLIRRRKRNVMMQLFLKQLVGDKIKIAQKKCSHCGFEPMDIEGAGSDGYYRYCPKCSRLVIDTYVPGMWKTMKNVEKDMVVKHGWKTKKEE